MPEIGKTEKAAKEYINQGRQTIHHPLPAMLVVLARIMILATQKRPADAAANAVIVRSIAQ